MKMLQLEGHSLVFVVMPVICLSEMFSAVSHFQKALDAEQQIAIELKNFIQKETERLKNLENLASSFESHASKTFDVEKHLSHPVNAFLLAKRFTTDWEDVENLLHNQHNAEKFSTRISKLRYSLPSDEDRIGSATALLRLQDTYKLTVRDIAQGDIVLGNTSPVLNAQQCFEIGQIAYQDQDYYHTVLWMQEALSRDERERNKTASRAQILDYLAFSLSQQGNTRHALLYTNELLKIEPDHERAARNKFYYEQQLSETALNQRGEHGSLDTEKLEQEIRLERSTDEYHKSSEFQHYEALCRGEQIQENPFEHKLSCYYTDNGRNPLLVIAPVKVEELYLSPLIVMYHDVFTNFEMEYVKEMARPRLMRATVQNLQTGKLETAFYRVSKSAWLKDSEDPVVEALSQRIEAISGLNQKTSEELQMNNYGIGGQYEPHYDYSQNENPYPSHGQGNRIATWLAYLSDVDAGGATVFVHLGLTVYPVKGAATFWYNLRANGQGDWRTRHAGCPVLAGSKWVSNKWMHERGQEFRRPCALDSNI